MQYCFLGSVLAGWWLHCFHLSSIDKQKESKIWAFHLLSLLCYHWRQRKAFSPTIIWEYSLMSLLKSFGCYFARILPWMDFKVFSFSPLGEFSHSLVYLPFILIHFTMGHSPGFILKTQTGFIYRNRNSYAWVPFKKIVQFNKSITFECLWVVA